MCADRESLGVFPASCYDSSCNNPAIQVCLLPVRKPFFKTLSWENGVGRAWPCWCSPSLQAGQFLWLLAKGTVQSPLKWLMRPLGHLPLVSRVQPSKGGCSQSLNCSLILLPHQSRWWICGDQGRDDGLGSFHRHWAPCFPPSNLGPQ